MKGHEVYEEGQIFFNVLPRGVDGYHRGALITTKQKSRILLLSGYEIGFVKEAHIPVTELIDPKNQLEVQGKNKNFKGELPVAHVKDTPEARKALSLSYDEWPSFDVYPCSPQVYT